MPIKYPYKEANLFKFKYLKENYPNIIGPNPMPIVIILATVELLP